MVFRSDRVPPVCNAARAAVGLFVLIVAIAACSPPTRLSAVPFGRSINASMGDIKDARVFPTRDPEGFVRIALEAARRETAYLASRGRSATGEEVNFLAISGGGDDGAFGVGLLVGWSEAGTRPVFKAVTGVSTGSLIAPFAFLGSKHDATIKELYTDINQRSIFIERGLLAGLLNDALTDTQPLRRLVRKYVTPELLAEIAAEYAKGRLLLIATTDLDAKVPVYWNMGAIAQDGSPKALRLFQEVLIASAAEPVLFPPVMIDVTVNGVHHQEMHVDGGVISQLFLYPPGLEIGRLAKEYGVVRKRRVYVIRNARLGPQWADVQRQTLSIASQAISALIAAQGEDAIREVYFAAKRDGIDFNLAYIPNSFTRREKEPFQTAYMRALYKVGYDLARKGYPWSKEPPGYLRKRAAHSFRIGSEDASRSLRRTASAVAARGPGNHRLCCHVSEFSGHSFSSRGLVQRPSTMELPERRSQ